MTMQVRRETKTPAGTIVSIIPTPSAPHIYCYHPEEDEEATKIGRVFDGDSVVFTNSDAHGPDVLRAIAELIEES